MDGTFDCTKIKRSISNGLTITQEVRQLRINQPDKANYQDTFKTMRELEQYIGVCSRQFVCAAVKLIAPRSEHTTNGEMKGIYKEVNRMKATNAIGLNFCPLNMDNVRPVLVTDASFDNSGDFKNPLGFDILMKDITGVSNIVHYASTRCRRVTRSILEAEVHALVLGFDA